MRSPRLLVGFLVLLVSAPFSACNEKQDRTALQGKWRAVEATSNGEAPPAGMLEKLILVFSRESVSIMASAPARFTIGTNFVPAHMDILNSRHQVGIYELKGDTLKVCFGMDGDRPTTFHTEKYTDHTYILLERVKK